MKSEIPRFYIRPPTTWWPLSYGISYGIEYGNGDLAVAQPVTMKLIDRNEPRATSGEAMLELHERPMDALQSLMDQLWNLGIRPKDIGTAGHLAATQEHLKDMQKLVSKAYE